MASELPGPQSHDDIANWLLRLSEALTRLNNGLLWAGASPGELERILAPAHLEGSHLAIDVGHAAACMRRFAEVLSGAGSAQSSPGVSVWEDLILGLRTMLAACAADSALWSAGAAPDLFAELRTTVYALERLCGHFERIH
jgi:hypothetical protein